MNKNLSNLDLKDKKVLVRVDFNVPIENGKITDDTRIEESLPTIKYLLNQNAKVILMSHLGRPDGIIDEKYSLKPCQKKLEELLNVPVKMAPDCVGDKVKKLINELKPKEVLLLENLRFHKEEEHPNTDNAFAKELASLGDFYINDAFGASHRKHSSIYYVPQIMQGKAALGLLVEKEVKFLREILLHPDRPFLAIIGGAKVSSKIKVLKALLQKVDVLLVGGAMAYTFMKASGYEVGDSLYENDFIEEAKEILDKALQLNKKIILPLDHVVVSSDNKQIKTVSAVDGISKGYKGMDIGPETIKIFDSYISKAKTIFWNGPMGVFEKNDFANGTLSIARMLKEVDATTIVGGGDSCSALSLANVKEFITHVSTGGGASLEFIENGSLPGVEVLST